MRRHKPDRCDGPDRTASPAAGYGVQVRLRFRSRLVSRVLLLMRLLHPIALCLLLASAPATALQGQRRPPTAPRPRPAAPVVAAPVPAPVTTAWLQGVAFDSLHREPLAGAIVQVEGAGRFGVADSLGRFLADSIRPGSYRLLIDHPMLDTLGITLVTPALEFAVDRVTQTIVTVPSPETLVGMFCPPARRALGPGALVGRVREPDTEAPAVGARVSLVWYDPDPVGLPSNIRPTRRPPRVREAVVGEDGTYRLCGLPEKYEGKLQAQRKDGGATAEVAVTQEDGLLALRSVSVAPLPVVAGGDTTGRPRGAARGTARVAGRVLTRSGAPAANARVGLMGSSAATLTRANGEFLLDSLPAGTQALVVRQIGYRPTEVPVELSSRTPTRVTVRLGEYVPELSPVEVVSRRDEGIQRVGFSDRRRTGATGHFMDSDQIERRAAMQFTDLMRTVPGLRVSSSGGQNVLTSTRGGCVTIYVDGAAWQQITPGDLDDYVRPQEIAAVEVYSGQLAPAQFSTPGSACSAVVVWTKSRVLQARGR